MRNLIFWVLMAICLGIAGLVPTGCGECNPDSCSAMEEAGRKASDAKETGKKAVDEFRKGYSEREKERNR